MIGPNSSADLGGAPRLDQEQADQDADRDRQDQRRQPGFGDRQPLDRRQHRNRRRDDRVAVEQRGRQHAQRDQPGGPFAAFDPCARSCASSAKEPPSPLLSARIATSTYLTVTTSISVQKTSDSTPKTCAWSTASGCGPMKLSFIA